MYEKHAIRIKDQLDRFIKRYHPDISLHIESNTSKSQSLLSNTYLSSANSIREYQAVIGFLKSTKFFLSNIVAYYNYEFMNFPLFKGLLFHIETPSKSTPYTKLESNIGFVKRNFGGIHQHEKYKFWISSDDLEKSYDALNRLFPFFNYLMKTNKDVRLYAYKDQVVFLISGSKNLFGFKNYRSIGKASDKELYENIVKNFNSYFFILESLSTNLSHSDIEENFRKHLLKILK